jgi:hypothetical protein
MREEAEYLYQIFLKGIENSFLSPLFFSNKTLIYYRTHGIYVSLFSFFSEGPKIVEYLLTF